MSVIILCVLWSLLCCGLGYAKGWLRGYAKGANHQKLLNIERAWCPGDPEDVREWLLEEEDRHLRRTFATAGLLLLEERTALERQQEQLNREADLYHQHRTGVFVQKSPLLGDAVARAQAQFGPGQSLGLGGVFPGGVFGAPSQTPYSPGDNGVPPTKGLGGLLG
jgi:hypothetical protein